MKRHDYLSKLALLASLATGAPAAMAAAPLPAVLAQSNEIAALPDGGWIGLEKNSLRLFDAGGTERASYKVRAKQLDLRASAQGAVAIVLDGDAEKTLMLAVDLKAGKLAPLPSLPHQAFGVETHCLFRDQQDLLHLFVAAKDGQAEQWMLGGFKPALVRKLALPMGNKGCRVDDARHTVFVNEPEMGVWAFEANSEAPPRAKILALREPHGTLSHSIAAIAVLPDGVAVLESGADTPQLFDAHGDSWTARHGGAAAGAAKSQQLATRRDGDAVQLLVRRGAAWSVASSHMAVQAGAGAKPPMPIVVPQAQTAPMARFGDAADDPAIWVHPRHPGQSRVLGTNKKQGLLVYDMEGKQTQFLAVGRLNNVDLRQGVNMDGQLLDLAVATQRDDNSVVVFDIDKAGNVREVVRIPTDLDKIYGICLYQPASGGLETFVNDADGRYRQYRIERNGKSYSGKLVRQFKVDSQPEACVADDKGGRLFLGEEKRGLWLMAADASAATTMTMVLGVGDALHADVEGVGIYYGKQANYLVVSSQGNNSYVVLDAAPPFAVRGSFRIGFNVAAGIDGSSETDGLEVTSKNMGGQYGQGMLVVQDGYKHLPDGPQNFKYVRWADVADALKLK